MALIEYRINVDANGNATVIQDVREIDPGDQIRFVATSPGTVIQFDGDSPFAALAAGVSFPVPMANAGPPAAIPVTKTNKNAAVPKRFVPELQEMRRTFHFLVRRSITLLLAAQSNLG
jgi:hypothetical protein